MPRYLHDTSRTAAGGLLVHSLALPDEAVHHRGRIAYRIDGYGNAVVYQSPAIPDALIYVFLH